MTNRYQTDREKAGQLRRQQAYRNRLKERGIRRRELMVTELEHSRLVAIVAAWHGEPSDLTTDQLAAVDALKPVEA